MAGLLVKYRSLLPEFLWQWHGSLQHFGSCGFPDLSLHLLFCPPDHAAVQTHTSVSGSTERHFCFLVSLVQIRVHGLL